MTYRAELYALVGLGLIVECPSGIVDESDRGRMEPPPGNRGLVRTHPDLGPRANVATGLISSA